MDNIKRISRRGLVKAAGLSAAGAAGATVLTSSKPAQAAFFGPESGPLSATAGPGVRISYDVGVSPAVGSIFVFNYTTNTYGDLAIQGNAAAGKVGIGTITPSEKLSVVGNISANRYIQVSSKKLKENIVALSSQEAIETLEELNPVKFQYKTDQEKALNIGFIAEDVPALVATPDRQGLSLMDIVAVLTKAVQEQQKTISALQEEVKSLRSNS